MKNIWRVVFGLLVVMGGIFGGKIEQVGAQSASEKYLLTTCTANDDSCAVCNDAQDAYMGCMEKEMMEVTNVSPTTTVPCVLSSTGADACTRVSAYKNSKVENYIACLNDHFNDTTHRLETVLTSPSGAINQCLSNVGLSAAGGGGGASGGGGTGADFRDQLVSDVNSYGTGEISKQAMDLCSRLTTKTSECLDCVKKVEEGGKGGWWTGLGCVNTNVTGLASQLIVFLLGLAGLFLLAQILIGAFRLTTSSGDPRAAQEARERITNAVIALLFIIFSVTLMRPIGVNIFDIPGFFSDSAMTP